MKTWKDKLGVELTVEQWLYVQSALRDAMTHNEENRWLATCGLIEELQEAVNGQVNEAVDCAMYIDDMESKARFADECDENGMED